MALYIEDSLLKLFVSNIAGSAWTTQITGTSSGTLLYLSVVAYKTVMDEIVKAFKSNDTFTVSSNRSRSFLKDRNSRYNIEVTKNTNSDVYHAIITLKDSHKIEESNETFSAVMYLKDSETHTDDRIKELLFDKINKYSSVPVLKEWIDYVYEQTKDEMSDDYNITTILRQAYEAGQYVHVRRFNATKNSIKSIIEEGLSTGCINIQGSNAPSVMLEDMSGLNSYLSLFGSILADKIQNKFKPKFIPGKDQYDRYLLNIDDYIHHKGIELYEAQRAVVQASVNNFKVNKHGFIVGEMGSGKTLQTGATFYVHNANRNKGFNAIIMCPSHLVEKWKSEMETYIPNSKGYIVHNLEELLSIEPKLRNRNRAENMFVIMSKEIAKLGYDERPSAIWNKYKNCYVCPECGKPLFKFESRAVPYSRKKVKVKVPLTELDFLKQGANNTYCLNEITYYDKDKGVTVRKTCNNKLWTTLNRDDDHDWLKLGDQGWINIQHIVPMTEKFLNQEVLNKKDTALFNKLFEQYNLYQNGEAFHNSYKGAKKYPVAKYIYKRMRGVFDYLALDEAHLLMNNSLQGVAAHHLMKAAGNSLLLTGTLLNGYASNIFYTLFRVCPKIMVQEGFTYNDEMQFARLFGAISKESSYELVRGYRRGKIGSVKEKKLPGISPLIFTKFLLNLTAFIALDDMAEGLPDYREIPIAINMDDETAMRYAELQQFFSERVSRYRTGSRKIMGSLVKLLTQYPDAPHCKRYVTNPDSGDLELESTSLEKAVRNKEQKLLEIIEEKLANGEKVLVYYNTINTTDLGDHIASFLAAEDIKAFELKASVKAEKRMEYITKELNKGAQVMITNPSLVETGLDLLDFTTIVFFQIGYNLSTMRQASRRSWRLSQTKDIEVYFLYYEGTIQEQAMALMATKLQAAQTIEGNFSEEGLKAMSQNDDLLTQIANNVVNDIKQVVNLDAFKSAKYVKKQSNETREHKKTISQIEYVIDARGQKNILPSTSKCVNKQKKQTYIRNEYVNNLLRLFV